MEAGLARSALDQEIQFNDPDGPHPEEPIPCDGIDDEEIESFDRDKPTPFLLKEFQAHISSRQAMRNSKGWAKVAPSDFQRDYAPILNKFRVLTSDMRLTQV